MEVRQPLLTAEEVAGLLGGRPQTVEQVMRAELLEARLRGRGGGPYRVTGGVPAARRRTGSTAALRRLIAGALHVAADAIYPPGGR